VIKKGPENCPKELLGKPLPKEFKSLPWNEPLVSQVLNPQKEDPNEGSPQSLNKKVCFGFGMEWKKKPGEKN